MPADGELGRIFREEYGRAVSVLVRYCGDIDIAEEAVQDAFTTAVQRWPASGVPPSPAGWVITTAKNRAIDKLRREAARQGGSGTSMKAEGSSNGAKSAGCTLVVLCMKA